MKNIKLIFMSLLLLVIATSCENDGGTSVIDVTEGATPNIRKVPTTDQGINIVALQSGGDINLGLTIGIGTGQIQSMDVIAFFTKNGVVSRGVLQTGITTFPTAVTYKKADLIKIFPAFASFGLSDKLVITTEITQKDGTITKMQDDKGVPFYGADIANSTVWVPAQTYTALCPLTNASLFNGNYKVTADAWQDYAVGDIIPVVYNPANGTFVFRVLNTKNPYLINASTSYINCTINPANNTVVITSNEKWNYGPGQLYTVTGSGTVASCTGDINLKLKFDGSADYILNLVKAP